MILSQTWLIKYIHFCKSFQSDWPHKPKELFAKNENTHEVVSAESTFRQLIIIKIITIIHVIKFNNNNHLKNNEGNLDKTVKFRKK